MATFLTKLVQCSRRWLYFKDCQKGLHWSSLACCKDFWHGNLLEKTCSRRWFYFKDQCFWIQFFRGRSGSGPRPLFRSNLLDKACSKRCFTSKISVSGSNFFGVDLYLDLYPGHFSNPDPHLIWIQVIWKNQPNFWTTGWIFKLQRSKLIRVEFPVYWAAA